MEFINWIVENGSTILEIVGSLVGIASLVTGLTNTPKDDKVVAKIQVWLGKLSFLTHKDKEGTFQVPGK